MSIAPTPFADLRRQSLRLVVATLALMGARLVAASEPVAPIPAVRISVSDAQMFFGYYDLPALDAATGRHLANRVTFRDRLPTASDEAELGIITLGGDGGFQPFARTRAWNFQQGAMLQWLGDGSGRVFYNDVKPDGHGYRGVLHDLATNQRTFTDRALANVSRDGRWGLTRGRSKGQHRRGCRWPLIGRLRMPRTACR